MSTVKYAYGSRTSLTSASLGTLASATYCVSSAYNNTTNGPLDLLLEVVLATTNTPSGNKQALVFAQASLDGTNFQTGPTSGTTTTDEPELTFIGFVPVALASTTERRVFSIAQAFGGVLPPYVQIVVKNDLGVALTSGTLFTQEVSATVA